MRNEQIKLLIITLFLIATLSAIAVNLPLVRAREVTIEVDIDATGKVTLSPNPTPVANGDTVVWHIRTGTFDRGFKVTMPADPNSPFGNKDSDLVSSVSPAGTCSRIELYRNPKIKWPRGVKRYTYRAETFQSPATTYTIGILERTVGGIAIPVDKLGLLTPYIALAVAVVAITVGTVYYTWKCWLGKAVVSRP